VDQLRLGEIHDAVLSAERGELPDRFHVRASGVLVVDIGTERVAQPLASLGLGRKEGGQGSVRSRCRDLYRRCSLSF
jgi:hypothetical protein